MKVLTKIFSLVFAAVLSLTLFSSCEVGLGEAIDMTAPEVKVASPVPTGSVSREFTISGSASDNKSISELTVTLEEIGLAYKWSNGWTKNSGSGWEAAPEALYSGSSKSFDWSITLSIPGANSGDTYTMTTLVKDFYGNSSSFSKDERSFTIDVNDPVVSITLPAMLKSYTEAKIKSESYTLNDSMLLMDLINKSFTIDGTQKEDTRLSTLYVMLDDGKTDTISSYSEVPDIRSAANAANPDPAVNLICLKTVEGSRSWNTQILESEIPDTYKTGKHLFRAVTESHDLAGNVERKVQGWFTYWNEADKPWIVAPFGDSEFKTSGQSKVYPSCSLQGQCYDDDGIKTIIINVYVYDETESDPENKWKLVPAKNKEIDLTSENFPTYYAWSINAIADNKQFKVVSKCIDKFGVESDAVTKYLDITSVNPPRLEIELPPNGSTVIGDESGNFTVKGKVSDDGALKKSEGCVLKMVRLSSGNKSRMLDYFDGENEVWNGSDVLTIDLEGSDIPEGGYYNYTFMKTFNLFTDFKISKTETMNSLTFIFKINDDKSSTIESISLQGDTEAPRLAFDKLTVRNSRNETASYDLANGNQPTIPPFETGDTIMYSGTWSDNTAMHWSPIGTKIGDFVVESKGVTLNGKLEGNGTWTTNYVTPHDDTTISVVARLTDFGGNTAKTSASYYITSSLPKLVRISSLNPDGAYKEGDEITLTMEFNKKVTFDNGGAVLTLNNGDTAEYDSSSNTNGSAKHYYKYVVGTTPVDALDVVSISANGNVWKDNDKNILKLNNKGTADVSDDEVIIPDLNLKNVRTLKIDVSAPSIDSVNTITGNGYYSIKREIFLTVNFNKDVIFDDLKKIQLKLDVGSDTKTLNPVSQTSAKTLLFKYLVEDGDNGSLSFNSFNLNGCSIKDKAGNILTNLEPASRNMNAIVVDTTAPAAPSVSGVQNNELVYAPEGKTVTITGYEEGAEKYYSVDNGTTWVEYNESEGIKLTANGTYNIKAYQVDRAGNHSEDSAVKQVTLDTGNILTSVTSSTPDGTYTNRNDEIYITLNFRKAVIVSGSKLKLNIKDKTDGTVEKFALPEAEPSTGATSVTYKYIVKRVEGANEACDGLEVTDFQFASITDATSQKNNISSYVELPAADSGNTLSDNRTIKIVTGAPAVESVGFSADGKTLRIAYSDAVSKNEGSIRLKMKDTFRAPAVMDKAIYDNCPSAIKAYYKEGTNGAYFEGGKLVSDLSTKYILDFDTNTQNATLTGLFIAEKMDEVEIPIDSTAVKPNGKMLEVDISDAYKLPVKGAVYTITIPEGLVLNVLGTESTAVPAGMNELRSPGVETPFVRIKKSNETISGTTVTQPWTASVKLDCQTPGSKIYYADASKTSSAKKYSTAGKVMAKDTASDHKTAPELSPDSDSNYTDNATFKIGSASDDKGYKVLIASRAYITVDGQKIWSDAGYEAAYRTVVKFYDRITKNGYTYRWIRGGDATSGGVSTAGFPFNWNTKDYGKARAMTKSGNYWYFVTWSINTNAYVGFIAGDMPNDAAANGPKKWIWGSCMWVGVKSEYPAYPGECLEMDTNGPDPGGRGTYSYQDKHIESR